MTTEIDSLVLEHLRAIRAKQGEHDERLTRLEQTTAGMRRDLAHMYGDVVEQRSDYDRLASRIDRIERRLELNDPPH